MWLPSSSVALGLAFAQIVCSRKIIHARQQACDSAANSAAYSACAMQASFGGSPILLQLIPGFLPEAAVSVQYDGEITIGGAQQLSPAKVFAPPSLSLSFISNSSQAFQAKYIVMGLDYQSQNENINLFWLQSSLQILDKNTGTLSSSSPPIVPYKSPNPLPGTGTHVYMFFVFQDVTGFSGLFKQNPQLALIQSAADFETFLSKTKLDSQPIAVSYFKSAYDGNAINGQAPAVLANLQSQKVSVSSKASISSPGTTTAQDSDHDREENESCVDEDD